MFGSWKSDLQSSLVVFLVALPLCLGIALASNAPMMSGLYAGIIGGIVVGFVSSSSLSVSGPAAGLTVIVASALATLGSFEAFTVAVVLSGVIQIVFALLKGGSIGEYFPNSVVKGMLAAIGILLILKQIPHAVGYDTDFMGDEEFFQASGGNTFTQIVYALRALHPGAVVITLLSMGIMLFWEKASAKKIKVFQIVPGALVAVLAAVFLNMAFKDFSDVLTINENHLVTLPRVDGLGGFISNVTFPVWSHLGNPQIYIIAFTIAIVGSLESLLSVDAIDKIDPKSRSTDKNRELLAQGIGNTLSGIVGGLPITAVIVRSSANLSSGAQSKLSAIMHGIWLLLCVVFIPDLLNRIPLAALAAILLLVGYKLTKPELIKSMYARGTNQFIPFVVTIVAILLTNLLMGILIGIVVGFYFVVRSNMHKSIVIVREDDLFLIKFYKDSSFLHKAELHRLLATIPSGSSVVIDGSQSVFIDNDIQDIIEEFVKRSKLSNIAVELKKSSLALCPLFRG
jgi:MFS superfamily sulfate permease-like transporter